MDHILANDSTIISKLEPLFSKISEGKVILFLGAGASVTEEKVFLSKHIMEYYQDSIQKRFQTDDITDFVDTLSAQEDFSRIEFDNYVYQLISKLEVTKTHEIIASIPWRLIITTNFDLLIEKAFEKIKNTSSHKYDLVTIRAQNEYEYTTSPDEIKYVKLNGCSFDRKKYPFVFSSDDFERVRPYYHRVLTELKSVSDEIIFLSIGYSYSDIFAKKLLNLFDKEDFRGRRVFHTIDPFIDQNRLEYLAKNKIKIINISISDFFCYYNKWAESNATAINKAKGYSFYNKENQRISVPPQLLLKIGTSIQQLQPSYRSDYISANSYYKGEEPNYSIVLKGYDVVRENLLSKAKKEVISFISQNNTNLIPIIFFTGNFGTGKSTFTYRFLNNISNSDELSVIALEVENPFHMEINALIELINLYQDQNIFFYYNYIERDSVFKQLLEFRNKLSCAQVNSNKCAIICSIRENLLERFKQNRDILNTRDINIDHRLDDQEIDEFLSRLRKEELISYKDEIQKKELISKVKNEFNGDSYITLLSLVDGKHFTDLIETYNALPKVAQDAMIFTSLVHQFNILMPIGLLRDLVSEDWENFRNDILQTDCKGILIQEQSTIRGSYPDLFFRTKHPIIAQKLVDIVLPHLDDKFEYIEKIILKISLSESNSLLAHDLLKRLFESQDYSINKINRLFDLAYERLSEDPHFLIFFSINLQHRNDLKSFEKALKIICYAETLFPYRNHKCIHRRAVLNFEIAKLYYANKSDYIILIKKYLREAEELFDIKQIMDPCSSYSYFNYLEFLIWIIDKIQMPANELLRRKIQIEDLFELAEKNVLQDINRILELHEKYSLSTLQLENNQEYYFLLEEYYENEHTRPLALILLYNYYTKNNESKKAELLIEEIESFKHFNEIAKFLFKYYGNNLHIGKNREKIKLLVNKNGNFEKKESLRYNYYMYVASSYNIYFNEAQSYLKNIWNSFDFLNPDYKMVWKDEFGVDCIFEGIIVKNKKGYYMAKITTFQRTFKLRKTTFAISEGQKTKLKLLFFYDGIRAEITEIIK